MLLTLFRHITGLDNPGSDWYDWWSGIGSDLGIFAAISIFLYKHNCHAKGCLRLGFHQVEGTPYITCRKHHPTIKRKADVQHIWLAHHKAIKAKE